MQKPEVARSNTDLADWKRGGISGAVGPRVTTSYPHLVDGGVQGKEDRDSNDGSVYSEEVAQQVRMPSGHNHCSSVSQPSCSPCTYRICVILTLIPTASSLKLVNLLL